jgi:spermidine synthase
MRKLPRVIESLDGIGGTVMLQTRETPDGERYELVVGGHYVMAASDGETERLLASRTLMGLEKSDGHRVLIGGLGLGLTLRETLVSDRVSRVWVAEIEEAVIRWNRTHLAAYNGRALMDPRVEVYHGDVMDLVRKKRRFFDAVLMDVDNGPSFLILEQNNGLYGLSGLKEIRRSLASGGVLGIWAYRPEPLLEERLTEIFGAFSTLLIPDKNLREDLPPTALYTTRKK